MDFARQMCSVRSRGQTHDSTVFPFRLEVDMFVQIEHGYGVSSGLDYIIFTYLMR